LRKLTCALVAIIAVMVPFCAFAAEYHDPDGSFTVQYEDPREGGGLYYYISESDNNLFGDISEQLEAEQKDISFFISQYDGNKDFQYQIMLWSLPAASIEGLAAENIPADITQLGGEDAVSVMEKALEGKISDDTALSPAPTELGGHPAIYVEGVGAENTPFLNDTFITNGNNGFIVANVSYMRDGGEAGKSAAYEQLGRIVFDDVAAAAVSPLPSEDTTAPTAAVTVYPEATVSPQPTPEPQKENFLGGVFSSVSSAFDNDPNFIWYCAGLLAVLIVIIIVLVIVRKRSKKGRRHRKDIILEPEENDLRGETSKISVIRDAPYEEEASGKVQRTPLKADRQSAIHGGDDPHAYPGGEHEKSKSTGSQYGGISEEEDEGMNEQEKDFAEDISKYTRQPGSEVNDISRNTMGGYTDDGGISEAIGGQLKQDNEPAKTESRDWRAGGSRMERRRKTRK